MNNKSIILIGMPGSGKSTIGVLLAKAVCMRFLDIDLLIQRREKKPLQKIINLKGNEYFSECEEKTILSLRQRGQVIATGGSAVLHAAAMEHLKSLGTIVYLDVAFPEIKKRLWNLKTRGIVLAPGQSIEDLFLQRKPYYEKYADITIRAGHTKTDHVVQMIIDQLGLSRCEL